MLKSWKRKAWAPRGTPRPVARGSVQRMTMTTSSPPEPQSTLCAVGRSPPGAPGVGIRLKCTGIKSWLSMTIWGGPLTATPSGRW